MTTRLLIPFLLLFCISMAGAEPRSDQLRVYTAPVEADERFADFSRLGKPDSFDEAVAEAHRKAEQAGEQPPERLGASGKVDLVLRHVVGAVAAPPDRPGQYVVYRMEGFLAFFGPTENTERVRQSLTELEILLGGIRAKNSRYEKAVVFPLRVDSPENIMEQLSRPNELVTESLDADHRLIERFDNVRALGTMPNTEEERAAVVGLIEAARLRSTGEWTGQRTIPVPGTLLLPPAEFDALARGIARQLFGDRMTEERLANDALPGRWSRFATLVDNVLKDEGACERVRKLFTEHLKALALRGLSQSHGAAEAFALVGRAWLLHRSAPGKHAFAVAVGALSADQLRDLASQEVQRDARLKRNLSSLLGHAAGKTSPSGPALVGTIPAGSLFKTDVILFEAYLQASKPPSPPDTGDAAVDAGLEELRYFLQGHCVLAKPLKLTTEDVERMVKEGAIPEEWSRLQRLLESAFGLVEAGELVERAGAALRRGAMPPEVTRSVVAQFGTQAGIYRGAMFWDERLARAGLIIHPLIHDGGDDSTRRKLRDVLIDATIEQLLPDGVDRTERSEILFTPESITALENHISARTTRLSDGLRDRLQRARQKGAYGIEGAELVKQAAREIVTETARRAILETLETADLHSDPKSRSAARERLAAGWGQKGQFDLKRTVHCQIDRLMGDDLATLPADLARGWLAENPQVALIDRTKAPLVIVGSDSSWAYDAPAQPRDPKGSNSKPEDAKQVAQVDPSKNSAEETQKWGTPKDGTAGDVPKPGTDLENPSGQPDQSNPNGQGTAEKGQPNAQGKNEQGKPAGSLKSGKTDGNESGKSPSGDSAGGGILPGDMPLLRAIFQSLAKYLGIEELAKKILEVAYFLKPELFQQIADALSDLAKAITPEELAKLAGDYNKIIAKLGPIIGQFDAAFDKLMNEGIKATLNYLVDEGLDKLTEEGLKVISEKTGIPLDKLRSLKNLPKSFDPEKAMRQVVAEAKREAVNRLKKELQSRGLPGGFVDDFASLENLQGKFEHLGRKAIDEARRGAIDGIGNVLGVKNLGEALNTPNLQKNLLEEVRKRAIAEGSKFLGVDERRLTAVFNSRSPEVIFDLGKERLRQEITKVAPLDPSFINRPITEWPGAVRPLLERELGRSLGEDASAIAAALLEQKSGQAVLGLRTHVERLGQHALAECGIDVELLRALYEQRFEDAQRRLRGLSDAGRVKLAQAIGLTKARLEEIAQLADVKQGAELLKSDLQRLAIDAGKVEPKLINVLHKPGQLEAYLREKLDIVISRAGDGLNQLNLPEEKRNEIRQRLQRLLEASEKNLLSATAELAEQMKISHVEIEALLKNDPAKLLSRLREDLLTGSLDKLASATGTSSAARDLPGKLEELARQANERAAIEISQANAALRNLPELMRDANENALALLQTNIGEHLRSFGALGVEQRQLLESLVASRWTAAQAILDRLPTNEVQALVEIKLLPAEAIDVQQMGDPARLEALGRETLARLLAGADGKALSEEALAAIRKGNTLEQIDAVRADIVARLGDPGEEVRRALANADPAEFFAQLKTELERRSKSALKLDLGDPRSLEELAESVGRSLGDEWNRELTTALGVSPGEARALLTQTGVTQSILITSLQKAVDNGKLEMVAGELKLDPQELGRFLQGPRLNASRAEVEAHFEEARKKARDELISKPLERAGIEEARLRARTGAPSPVAQMN